MHDDHPKLHSMRLLGIVIFCVFPRIIFIKSSFYFLNTRGKLQHSIFSQNPIRILFKARNFMQYRFSLQGHPNKLQFTYLFISLTKMQRIPSGEERLRAAAARVKTVNCIIEGRCGSYNGNSSFTPLLPTYFIWSTSKKHSPIILLISYQVQSLFFIGKWITITFQRI